MVPTCCARFSQGGALSARAARPTGVGVVAPDAVPTVPAVVAIAATAAALMAIAAARFVRSVLNVVAFVGFRTPPGIGGPGGTYAASRCPGAPETRT